MAYISFGNEFCASTLASSTICVEGFSAFILSLGDYAAQMKSGHPI